MSIDINAEKIISWWAQFGPEIRGPNSFTVRQLMLLDEIRHGCRKLGIKQVMVTSTSRPAREQIALFNRKVGAYPLSAHLVGSAIDIDCIPLDSNENNERLAKYLANVDIVAHVYSRPYGYRFIHVDSRFRYPYKMEERISKRLHELDDPEREWVIRNLKKYYKLEVK